MIISSADKSSIKWFFRYEGSEDLQRIEMSRFSTRRVHCRGKLSPQICSFFNTLLGWSHKRINNKWLKLGGFVSIGLEFRFNSEKHVLSNWFARDWNFSNELRPTTILSLSHSFARFNFIHCASLMRAQHQGSNQVLTAIMMRMRTEIGTAHSANWQYGGTIRCGFLLSRGTLHCAFMRCAHCPSRTVVVIMTQSRRLRSDSNFKIRRAASAFVLCLLRDFGNGLWLAIGQWRRKGKWFFIAPEFVYDLQNYSQFVPVNSIWRLLYDYSLHRNSFSFVFTLIVGGNPSSSMNNESTNATDEKN